MAKIILLKLTSRERPEVLFTTLETYLLNAVDRKNMVWLFSFDENDLSYNNVDFKSRLEFLMKEYNFKYEMVFGTSTDKINAINRDINETKLDWDILVNVSDDMRIIKTGYDNIIRDACTDDLDCSIWSTDGWQNRINTFEIIGRKYYERFNYIYYPGYKSFFCDNESTLVAQKLGKQIKLKEQIVRHDHPQWNPNGDIKVDELYKQNDKYWAVDQALYNKRLTSNFQ